MNIVVCVKQVPDTTAEKRLGADLRLDRAAVESILNPFDEYAIEEALRIKEAQGADVTLLCMGPQAAEAALRKGLAMGCDNAVLVSDTGLAGTDSLGTAHVLAAALRKLAFDLVLMGMQSTDARTGQVPAALACFLDAPLLTQAAKLDVDAGQGTARIHRQTEGGMLVLEARLPAVVSVTKAINEPRYPALRGIMLAKKKEIRLFGVSDAGLDALLVGASSRTRVVSVSKPAPRAKGVIVKDEPAAAARKIADYLHEAKVI